MEQKPIWGGWMSKWDFSDPTCAAIRPDRSPTLAVASMKWGYTERVAVAEESLHLANGEDGDMREPTAMEIETGAARRSLLPSLAVIVALLVCKGLLYGTALLAVIGVAVDIPPGPWAIAVDLAVALAVIAFWLSRRRHGVIWPTLLATLGAILVIGYMHGPIPVELEWAGLILLLVAAFLDWKAARRRIG